MECEGVYIKYDSKVDQIDAFPVADLGNKVSGWTAASKALGICKAFRNPSNCISSLQQRMRSYYITHYRLDCDDFEVSRFIIDAMFALPSVFREVFSVPVFLQPFLQTNIRECFTSVLYSFCTPRERMELNPIGIKFGIEEWIYSPNATAKLLNYSSLFTRSQISISSDNQEEFIQHTESMSKLVEDILTPSSAKVQSQERDLQDNSKDTISDLEDTIDDQRSPSLNDVQVMPVRSDDSYPNSIEECRAVYDRIHVKFGKNLDDLKDPLHLESINELRALSSIYFN
jgi:hypothetical protein